MPFPRKGAEGQGAGVAARKAKNQHRTTVNWMTKANPNHPQYDPACRERLIAHNNRNRPLGAKARQGLPYGWTLADWKCRRAYQMNRATELVEKMKKLDLIEAPEGSETDATRAEEALVYAVSVVREDQIPVKDRLAAARTVLEWTKSKPVAKSAVTVSAAEDWLAGVADAAGI
jgi:hypothetical protein